MEQYARLMPHGNHQKIQICEDKCHAYHTLHIVQNITIERAVQVSNQTGKKDKKQKRKKNKKKKTRTIDVPKPWLRKKKSQLALPRPKLHKTGRISGPIQREPFLFPPPFTKLQTCGLQGGNYFQDWRFNLLTKL